MTAITIAGIGVQPIASGKKSYKHKVENRLLNNKIQDFEEKHTERNICFTLKLNEQQMEEANATNDLVKYFELENKLQEEILCMLEPTMGLCLSLENVNEMMDMYFDVALRCY